MAATLDFELVSPEKLLVSEAVEMVVIPGAEGDIGVLPGHAPLLAALKTGQMWYRKGGETKYAFLDGGEVQRHEAGLEE